jgi:hypothetical protein
MSLFFLSNHQQQWLDFGVKMAEFREKMSLVCEILLSCMWTYEKKKKEKETMKNDEK